jgi:hypothetical protein
MAIHGSCLCGAVKYEIDGPLGDASSCHCSMCRKAHGAAFGTYAGLNPDEFRWVSGEDMVSVYNSSPDGGRCFCQKCGSTLGAMQNGKVGWITLGPVDGDPGVRPQLHIFVGSKAPWHDITDQLPQFDEWPPAK